jgi:hypothetical protein
VAALASDTRVECAGIGVLAVAIGCAEAARAEILDADLACCALDGFAIHAAGSGVADRLTVTVDVVIRTKAVLRLVDAYVKTGTAGVHGAVDMIVAGLWCSKLAAMCFVAPFVAIAEGAIITKPIVRGMGAHIERGVANINGA